MIDMKTMTGPRNYSPRGNSTKTVMILADEYKGLERKRKAFVQETKFPRAGKSAAPTTPATIDTRSTPNFISEELADNLAALGKVTRTRRQVRLNYGRCSGINAQLEVKFISLHKLKAK